MTDDDLRDDDEPSNGGFPIAIVIAVVVVVLLLGSLASYAGAATSSPPAGPGVCATACTMWVKIDCPGGRILGTCTWDRPVVFCGPPVHTCGVNPPPPP